MKANSLKIDHSSQDTLSVSLQLRLGEFCLDASFETPSSGITAICGPSGCGKTTLLRAISGLQTIDSGSISINGQVWNDSGINLPVHNRHVGYVFQEPSLFSHLNVKDNLEYGLKRRSKGFNEQAIFEVAELLDIQDLLDRSVDRLSGGEQQRVAIGRAILARPKVLLMDEPLASLDMPRKREVLPYLEALQKQLKIPILYVSHSLDEIVKLADHLVLMSKGKVIASGPLMEVLASPDGKNYFQAEEGEVFTILEAAVVKHCPEHHLTEVESADLLMQIPAISFKTGEKVRLRLAARDISLNLERAVDSSILNIFESVILAIEDTEHPSQKLVRLEAGGSVFMAQISALSCLKLDLTLGKKVYAQIKAASLIQ